MKTLAAVIFALMLAGCSGRSSTPPKVEIPAGAKEITFPATDGQTVYADLYQAGQSPAKAVVLMFHQAGSNAGEYATIAPQIGKLGADCLATDQRSGGNMFDRKNRTATTAKGKEDYMAAYNDLQGAVAWAKSQGYKTIIPWGSSYSASLTLKLLSENPDLAAGLVFSPGEYMDDKNIVKTWAAAVKQPVFFACTPDELKEGRQEIYNALNGGKPKGTLLALQGGVHGSSTCIQGKSPAAEKYMMAVTAFVRKIVK